MSCLPFTASTIKPMVFSAPALPMPERDYRGLSFTERYRPRKLDEIKGQDAVVKVLRAFAAKPISCAFILSGETGTGKSSAAIALADALGCVERWGDAGGVYRIASGKQTADSVREIGDRLWNCPMYGSGWRVCIVEEADQCSVQAATSWNDIIESLPTRCVLVFTTNHPDDIAGKENQRFMDRCRHLRFQHSPTLDAQGACFDIATSIFKDHGRTVAPETMDRIFAAALVDGSVSYRRVVRACEAELA